ADDEHINRFGQRICVTRRHLGCVSDLWVANLEPVEMKLHGLRPSVSRDEVNRTSAGAYRNHGQALNYRFGCTWRLHGFVALLDRPPPARKLELSVGTVG